MIIDLASRCLIAIGIVFVLVFGLVPMQPASTVSPPDSTADLRDSGALEAGREEANRAEGGRVETARVQLVDDPVTGEPEPEDRAARRPLAIVIENHPNARPQWGLSLASRVYEAITEGGITRYLAVFGANDADRVGPVRSARTQFLDYVVELNAAFAHVGGSANALDLIEALRIKDINQFWNARPYRRIQTPHLAFEHTVFASTTALRVLIGRRGWSARVSLDHPTWKDDPAPCLRPPSQTVTIDFSTPAFRVSWVYRPSFNDYQRFLAGVPDVDAATGQVVSAKSIAIAVIPRVHGRTRIGEDTWTFSDIGSGKAWVVQDGTVAVGRWQKPSRTDRLRFLDAAGGEQAVDRGRQWIEIVPPEVIPVIEPVAAAR